MKGEGNCKDKELIFGFDCQVVDKVERGFGGVTSVCLTKSSVRVVETIAYSGSY